MTLTVAQIAGAHPHVPARRTSRDDREPERQRPRADRRAYTSLRGRPDPSTAPNAASAPLAAASRTTTCSPTSVSTSSSRSSASTRARPRSRPMADPIRRRDPDLPFNFAPTGWALCDGQLLPISQNTALFSLLGTTYGGDGKSTFALPDLQGRAPMHPGQGPGLSRYDLGRDWRQRHRDAARVRDASAHATRCSAAATDAGERAGPGALARLAGRRTGLRGSATSSHGDARPRGGRSRRRRPAAQQPPALPDAHLHHRPPGHLPAAAIATLVLRPETDADRCLLEALFADLRTAGAVAPAGRFHEGDIRPPAGRCT